MSDHPHDAPPTPRLRPPPATRALGDSPPPAASSCCSGTSKLPWSSVTLADLPYGPGYDTGPDSKASSGWQPNDWLH